MKYFYLTMLFITVCFSSKAQNQIPNYSFEEWSVSPLWPTGWLSWEDSTYITSNNLIQRRSGGSQGSYSLKLVCYQQSVIVSSPTLEISGVLTETPKGILFDYFNQVEDPGWSGFHMEIYFYDSVNNYIKDYSWTPSQNNNSPILTPSSYYFSFPGAQPKSYLLNIANFGLFAVIGDYSVVDNIRFTNKTSGNEEIMGGVPELTLYPNPAMNTLQLTNLSEETTEIKVLGTDGKAYLQTRVMGEKHKELPVDMLSPGIYHIQLLNTEGALIACKRLIKL